MFRLLKFIRQGVFFFLSFFSFQMTISKLATSTMLFEQRTDLSNATQRNANKTNNPIKPLLAMDKEREMKMIKLAIIKLLRL